MSTYKIFILVCDHPGCEVESDAGAPTAGEVRMAARLAEGWSITRAGDYCPEHAVRP